MAKGNEMARIVCDVPLAVYNPAELHAENAGVSFTNYFRAGHRLMYDLASRGSLRIGSKVHMHGMTHALPLLSYYPDLTAPAINETKRLNLQLPDKTAEQIDELVGASTIQTRTAYAISNLGLLNGLCDLRDAIDPRSAMEFSVSYPSSEGKVSTPNFILLDLSI